MICRLLSVVVQLQLTIMQSNAQPLGSCVALGLTGGCCINGTCQSGSPPCYCDEACFSFGDCCSDIETIGCFASFSISPSFLPTPTPTQIIMALSPSSTPISGSIQAVSLLTPENAVLGLSSVLTCEVFTSLPVAINLLSVQWMHRGSLLATNGSNQFVPKQGSETVYESKIILSNTTIEHSGQYSCLVSLDNRESISAKGNFTVAFFNIDVQVGVADGFPTQPLLGSTTTLNCSLAFHPQVIKSSILTIDYLWSSNGVPRGSGQNLVLLNLSTDDAMNYSCQVMVSSADSRFLIREITAESAAYNLMIKLPAPMVQIFPGGRQVYYVGENLNLTCSSSVHVAFSWRASNITTQPQELFLPNKPRTIDRSSLLALRPLHDINITCIVTIPGNTNIYAGEVSTFLSVAVPSLNVTLYSSTSDVVLDISGYNSFTLRCSGKFTPSFEQTEEIFSFMVTKNHTPITSTLLSSLVSQNVETVSQNSSVQQTVEFPGPYTVLYNCTVAFSINGSLIAIGSNTTLIKVKGSSPPAAPIIHKPSIISAASVLIRWSVPEVTYSPEQYNVYYTTPSSNGCSIPNNGYNRSTTLYGLNQADFFAVRDQQYNITLNNLHPNTMYCYKVVAINSEGRNESTPQTFTTLNSACLSQHSLVPVTHLIAAVVGSFLFTCFGTVVITSVVTVFVTKRHQSKQSRPAPTSNWCEPQQHNYEANSEMIYEMVDSVKMTEEPDYDFVGQNNACTPHTHTQSQ